MNLGANFCNHRIHGLQLARCRIDGVKARDALLTFGGRTQHTSVPIRRLLHMTFARCFFIFLSTYPASVRKIKTLSVCLHSFCKFIFPTPVPVWTSYVETPHKSGYHYAFAADAVCLFCIQTAWPRRQLHSKVHSRSTHPHGHIRIPFQVDFLGTDVPAYSDTHGTRGKVSL